MDSMFDILMGLPLFKGVSKDRMAKTVGTSKFHFLKYLPGETIFRPEQQCTEIAFIISGTVEVTIANPDGRFSVSQSLAAQDVVSPDFLFGKITSYPGLVKAKDTVGMLLIDKRDYITILHSDDVLLFNYINLLSMNAQKAVEGILAVSTGDIAERIAFWISALTQPRSFDIRLECRQRDLTGLFGIPRTTLRAALEDLKQKELIDYNPNCIHVLDRRGLLALLHNHSESED